MPIHFGPIGFGAGVVVVGLDPDPDRPAPDRLAPDRPCAGPPQRRTAQNFVFFFTLPPQFSFLLPSLGCVHVEFWWCLKAGTLKHGRFGFLAHV